MGVLPPVCECWTEKEGLQWVYIASNWHKGQDLEQWDQCQCGCTDQRCHFHPKQRYPVRLTADPPTGGTIMDRTSMTRESRGGLCPRMWRRPSINSSGTSRTGYCGWPSKRTYLISPWRNQAAIKSNCLPEDQLHRRGTTLVWCKGGFSWPRHWQGWQAQILVKIPPAQ